MCNCMVFDVTAIFFWITAFLKKLTFLAKFRASDFLFQKKEFSVSKKGKFRFDSVSLLPKLNSMKSQYRVYPKKYSIESKLSLD